MTIKSCLVSKTFRGEVVLDGIVLSSDFSCHRKADFLLTLQDFLGLCRCLAVVYRGVLPDVSLFMSENI